MKSVMHSEQNTTKKLIILITTITEILNTIKCHSASRMIRCIVNKREVSFGSNVSDDCRKFHCEKLTGLKSSSINPRMVKAMRYVVESECEDRVILSRTF